MELIQIQVAGTQIAKGGFQIFPKAFCCHSACLGCNVNLFPEAFKCSSKFALAVCVKSGGIKETDACVISFSYKTDCLFL